MHLFSALLRGTLSLSLKTPNIDEKLEITSFSNYGHESAHLKFGFHDFTDIGVLWLAGNLSRGGEYSQFRDKSLNQGVVGHIEGGIVHLHLGRAHRLPEPHLSHLFPRTFLDLDILSRGSIPVNGRERGAHI